MNKQELQDQQDIKQELQETFKEEVLCLYCEDVVKNNTDIKILFCSNNCYDEYAYRDFKDLSEDLSSLGDDII